MKSQSSKPVWKWYESPLCVRARSGSKNGCIYSIFTINWPEAPVYKYTYARAYMHVQTDHGWIDR